MTKLHMLLSDDLESSDKALENHLKVVATQISTRKIKEFGRFFFVIVSSFYFLQRFLHNL